MRSETDEARRLEQDERRMCWRVLAIAGVTYAWLLSRGSLNPFGAEQFGLTFNSMLDHLLRGRWDVDPGAIGYEAFVHDGRTYAYFGPFPALLRAPLLLIPTAILPDWRELHVARLSCWGAIMVGVVAQTRAMLWSLTGAAPRLRQRLGPPLAITAAMSGAPLLAWRGALIYHEPILWAWALAAIFVMLALPVLAAPGPAGGRRLAVLALCAGLCVLTRVTTGAGLLIATVGLVGLDQWRPGARWRSLVAPVAVLGLVGVAILAVNQGRWGNPLLFADLRMQTVLVANYPDRLVRLQRHGLFEVGRLPTGLLYYFFPIWTEALERIVPLHDRLIELYDAVELPASSLLLTNPAWAVLAVWGGVALFRRPVPIRAAVLIGGLALAPVLMLTAWYLAFRYRVEFVPLLLGLACLGLRDRAPHLRPGWIGTVLTVLCVLQVASSMLANATYAYESFRPPPRDSALRLHCLLTPSDCRLPPVPDE